MAISLDGKKYALSIERMPEGGFVVMDGLRRSDYNNDYCGPRFASTSIEETLEYCKRKLDTEHGEGK